MAKQYPIMIRTKAAFCLLLPLFASCDASISNDSTTGRWYTDEQVRLGERIFSDNCASCHGDRAQGLVADWQRRLPNGSYPPPPLNGTGHAWHHSLSLLTEIVQKGGSLYDGKMPGFQGRLKDNEQLAAIAWFQSLWSDETYRLWEQGNQPQQGSGKSILTPGNGEN